MGRMRSQSAINASSRFARHVRFSGSEEMAKQSASSVGAGDSLASGVLAHAPNGNTRITMIRDRQTLGAWILKAEVFVLRSILLSRLSGPGPL